MTSPKGGWRTAEILRRMEEQFPDSPYEAQTPFTPSSDSSSEALLVWGLTPTHHGVDVAARWLSAFGDPRPETATEEPDAARQALDESIWGRGPEITWTASPVGAGALQYGVARRLAERAASRIAAGRLVSTKAAEGTAEPPLDEILAELAGTVTAYGDQFDPHATTRVRLDVEYVWRRLTLLFSERQARIWLRSHNAAIGGRPLDAVRNGNTAEVVGALDAEEQGSFG